MKKLFTFLTTVLFIIVLFRPASFGCTAFLLADSDYLLFGHNYDWHISDGLIVVNKKGVRKTAIPNNAVRFKQLSWVSKFGSITFNQYGCELPIIGMNEKGLIITGLILEGSAYPKYAASDNRPYIGNAQWKQYLHVGHNE